MKTKRIKLNAKDDQCSIFIDLPYQDANSMQKAAKALAAARLAVSDLYFEDSEAFNTVRSDNASVPMIDEQKEPVVVTTPREQDAFRIRKRVPNNVVDISELTIGKAETNNALVRCPHCGQSHAILAMDEFNYYIMVRDFEKNEFFPVGDPFNVNETTEEELLSFMYQESKNGKEVSKLDYFNDIQTLLKKYKKESIDIVVNNDSLIKCPVCHKDEHFIEWKEAFVNPQNYFEFNEICDACGGEMLGKNTKSSTKSKSPVFKFTCESCGHEKIKSKK